MFEKYFKIKVEHGHEPSRKKEVGLGVGVKKDRPDVEETYFGTYRLCDSVARFAREAHSVSTAPFVKG